MFFYLTITGQVERNENTAKENETYIYQEVMPEYKTGWKDFLKDLNEELDFNKTVNGSIWLYAVIDKTGSISVTKTAKGINTEVDAKIVDAVTKLQGWKPGKHHNKKISTDFPIYLRIEKGKVKR
jgi:spermidine/putrescine-binding protein